MKQIKKVLISSILLYTLIGCSSNNVVGVDKVTSPNILRGSIYSIFTPITMRLSLPGILSPQGSAITSEEGLNRLLSSNKSISIKEKRAIKNTILSHIDFEKENILINSFNESVGCDYDEKYIKRTPSKVDIVISVKKNVACTTMEKGYFFIYKVSKNIKKVGLKVFRHDYVVVEMK